MLLTQYAIILKSHYLFPVMRVLFVCVGNSCRSQMAEAIARSQGISAESAGTHPAKEVSTQALQRFVRNGYRYLRFSTKEYFIYRLEIF